jgi:cellobiose phosphorylase
LTVHYRGELVLEATPAPLTVSTLEELLPSVQLLPAGSKMEDERGARLGQILPWFGHNALVHYLSPRGLEQYSGGGWGTRDVCQGPVEMLLALERPQPVRDLLMRVMSAQNPDGDWPQWFMFFERERGIRAGDSHGDIVFWPLLVLAQYLLASGDGSILDEGVRFFDARGEQAGELGTVWQHAQRALSLVDRRVIDGTRLAAYGHGDWNDALQPADPRLREHLCSAWTVTLHYQMLTQLSQALRRVGRNAEAVPLERSAAAVRDDFQRLLLVDGVLAGYALFENGAIRQLLHPSDHSTGVHYSALAMIHAILEDLFTPDQAREHLRLIEAHLHGPDGLRLFDAPMSYHGGPQRLFQRAESATFFGREIGLMYMHAHLRYAQALAHLGEAERFFEALCQANPIGIRSVVPAATMRQSNCYYSSSDAAFADRYQASAEYGRVARGAIALDGGWRVYSSGAGISLGLILRRFLGLSFESSAWVLDPVMPAALDGLRAQVTWQGYPLDVQYRIGTRGAGVAGLTLNGRALEMTHDPNPHRRGAARVSTAAVREQLSASANRLQVQLD